MKLFIYTESSFSGSRWFNHIIKGFYDEATRKRCEIKYINDELLSKHTIDEIFGSEKKILVLIGTSVALINRIIPFFRNNGVHLILINYEIMNYLSGISSVLMDYEQATYESLSYIQSYGKSKIALMGIYPDSGTDRLKESTFISYIKNSGRQDAERDIFYNNCDMRSCCRSVMERINEYDALLCSNEIAAIALAAEIRQQGGNFPKGFTVFSFGDMNLSKYMRTILSPEISVINIDYAELGRQAVLLYLYLCKNPEPVSITVKVSTNIHINLPADDVTLHRINQNAPPLTQNLILHDFYNDSLVDEIIRFENCIACCDRLDIEILYAIRRGFTQAETAEMLFSSEGAVVYRLKKIMATLAVEDKAELFLMLDKYLTGEGLDKLRYE